MELTRKKAIELHKRMWEDMKCMLGDCPYPSERSTFKHRWISAHKKEIPEIKDLEYIHNNCFLCAWVAQEHEHDLGTSECENLCPINWSNLTNKLINKNDFGCHGFPNTCMFGSSKNDYRDTWQTESITDILDLPERGVEE